MHDPLTAGPSADVRGSRGDGLEIVHHGRSEADRSDARFRAVVQATSLAAIANNGRDAIDIDNRYLDLTGLEFDPRLPSVHDDDRERMLQAFEERKEPEPCRLLTADGSWRHVEFRWVDTAEETITVIVDNERAAEAERKLIDELAQLQSQMEQRTSTLQSSVSSLAERNADLDLFAHAAAHDLKAPLRATMAFSELAAEAIGDEHAARPFLGRIEQNSARMAGMVDSLLQLASAGRSALAIRACAVEPIVEQVRKDLSLEIEKAGTIFDVAELDPVLADPTALYVILTNLVANSVKYSADGASRISITSATDGEHVVLTVTDNGIGFDQSKAAEIFEPFRRLHSRDQFEGSGVGLAICQRLANRLDADIWATARNDGGTAVSLRIPAAVADA